MAKVSKGGLKAAIKKTRGNETKRGNVDLPPGIKNGTATLVEGVIGKYKSGNNKGESYVRLAGTVVSPKQHTYTPRAWKSGKGKDGGEIVNLDSVKVKTEGLRTQLMFPLCETRRTLEENVDDLFNTLRRLGAETNEIEDEDDIKEIIEGLVEEGVNFEFWTRASDPNANYPQEGCWENWGDSIEASDNDDDDDDGIEEDDDDEDNESDEYDEDEDEDEDEEDPPFGTADELEEIADKAENGTRAEKKKAQAELDKRAEAAGLDPESTEYENADWHEIAQMIRDADVDEDDDDEESIAPEVGEAYLYKPPRKRKAIEVTVKSSNKRKETCTLVDNDDNEFKNVAWDKLEEA